MFGSKKNITDRAKDLVTEYADAKFEDYRGQISLDLARGLAALAGLVALWTLAVVCVMFLSFTLALLLGWIFSFWLKSFAYVLSFALVATALLSAAYYLFKNKEKYIEEPVFKIMAETLRSPETWSKRKTEQDTKTNGADAPKQTIPPTKREF